MSSKPVPFSGILFGVTIALAGCGPSTGPSRLSGTWYSKELSERIIFPDGRVQTAVYKENTPVVTIKNNGSFDWTQTMLALIGDVSNLRQPGDRVDSATSPGASVSIVKAEYTPWSSDVEMLETPAGPEQPIHVRCEIRSGPLGVVRYRQTRWSSSPDQPRSIVSGRLYRSGSAS